MAELVEGYSSPCKDEICRVQMINDMFKEIKGTALLLEEIQPDPNNYDYDTPELRKQKAFKTLIATMLSVRSQDETTLKVIEKLWKVYSTPKDLAEAPIEKLEELIHSSGTYRQKSKRIKEAGRIIHEEYLDEVPGDRDALLKIPGVGRKVANCVLVTSFCIPAIPVDTHVHRISNRLGWCRTKDPNKTEIALMKLFPEESWVRINYTMVSFGKQVCRPINPKCERCPVENRCPKLIQKKPKKKKK